MKVAVLLIITIGSIGGLAGCGKVQARTPDPILDTPSPPPHIIVPATVTIPEAEPTPPPPRSRETQPMPARPPERTTPPATPPPIPQETPVPPPTLQTASNIVESEQRTRTLIAKANGDLGRIDYQGLGRDARGQYDTAKRFIRQAEDALKDKNVVFARELADKAASLASFLIRDEPAPQTVARPSASTVA